MDKELLRVEEAMDFLSVTAVASGWSWLARVDREGGKLVTNQ